MRAVLAIILALGVQLAPLLAQSVPQLYDVTGVAADDVLNIRAAPSAQAQIIGALERDARAVEVVATNPSGTWGQVNTGEAAGWVSLRYMVARGVMLDDQNLPVGLRCFGTEPFWSLIPIDGALRYQTPAEPARDLALWRVQDSAITGDLHRILRFAGLDGPGVAFVYPAACSDGMSDRAYGLSISAMMGLDRPMLSGCCSLTR